MFTVAGLLFAMLIFIAPVQAQDSSGEVVFDLDSLPPQPMKSAPVEAVPPVENIPVATPVVDASAVPSEPLTPIEPAVSATGAPTQGDVPHSGLYYNSDSFVPSSSLGSDVGPRKVDPKYEPGSRFVVVKRGASENSREAQLVAARRALKLGRYSSALEIYERLYKKSPKNKQVLMGLAVAQQYSGFTESAIATYEELLSVDPKNTDATVNMLGLIKTQYPSVAYRKLQDLWNRNSQNPGIAAQLGLASASIGNAQDAIRYLGIASSMEPKNASHFYNMAVVSDQAGAHKDAMELYQKALELDVAYGGGRSIPRDQVYDRLAQLRRL